jgi:hypothetical protein
VSLTDRTIAAALTLAFAAGAPQPSSGPRYHWAIAQDAGAPDATASAGDAGSTPHDRASELERAMRAYEEALRRRKENSQ